MATKLVSYVLIIKEVVLVLSSQVAAEVCSLFLLSHVEDEHQDYIFCLIVFYILFLSLFSTGFQREVHLLGISLRCTNYLSPASRTNGTIYLPYKLSSVTFQAPELEQLLVKLLI